jgi:hypothetical protein
MAYASCSKFYHLISLFCIPKELTPPYYTARLTEQTQTNLVVGHNFNGSINLEHALVKVRHCSLQKYEERSLHWRVGYMSMNQ